MDFKFNISLPVPEVLLKSGFMYYEVKKASGFCYMLLILITESVDKSEKLVHKLESVGVPAHLHGIFAHEMDQLFSKKIIELSRLAGTSIFQENKFDEYTIGSFQLTEKGAKLLKDGVVPTGNQLNKEINLVWTPWSNLLSFNDKNRENQIINIKNTQWLSDLHNGKFEDNVKWNEGEIQHQLKDFVADHMKSSQIALYKNEAVFDETVKEYTVCYYRRPAELTIDLSSKSVSVTTRDSRADNFISRNMDSEGLSQAVVYLNGFGESNTKSSVTNSGIDLANVYIQPKKLSELPKEKISNVALHFSDFKNNGAISILSTDSNDIDNLGNENKNSHNIFVNHFLMDRVIPGAFCIKIESKDSIYGYAISNDRFAFNVSSYKTNEDIVPNIAVEFRLKCEEIRDLVVSALMPFASDYSIENLTKIMSFMQKLNDTESFINYVQKWINGSDMKMAILLEICQKIEKIPDLEFKKKTLSEIRTRFWDDVYAESLDVIKNDDEIKDNIEFLSPKFVSISRIYGLSITEILKDVIAVSDRTEDTPVNQYYYFYGLGYSEETVLSVINPITNDFINNGTNRLKGLSLDALCELKTSINKLAKRMAIDISNYSTIQSSDIKFNQSDIPFYNEILSNIKTNLPKIEVLKNLNNVYVNFISSSAVNIRNTLQSKCQNKNDKNKDFKNKHGGHK